MGSGTMRTLSRRIAGCAVALAVVAGALWPSAAGAAAPKAPNDPLWGHQWGMRRIGLPAAWARSQGKGITVAVVDSGVSRTHEDLKGQLSSLQYDTVQEDPYAGDASGHGTLVAGVIAAVANNKTGIAGVAPKAKIMALRAFPVFKEDEGTSAADVAEAITWATAHGAQVINLSLSGSLPTPDTLQAVVDATLKGVLVVAAAGNESQPLCGFPGGYPNVICVGASDELDMIASFSNYAIKLDVVAPGTAIWSTGVMSGQAGLASPTDTFRRYSAVPGTSFASPFVAGVGALLMSMGASNLEAGLIIRSTAKDLGLPGYDLTYGFGRLDAKAAVDMCAQMCGTLPLF